MSPRLSHFSTLTFDCYGTLIDWETGIWDALQPLLARNPSVDVSRAEALAAFADLESDEEAATPKMVYEEILAVVHRRLAARFGLDTSEAADRAFGESVPHWPAFPDTAEALRSLARQSKLVILSNISERSFAASNRKLGVTFDAVCTAEAIGSYKPSAENFVYLAAKLRDDLGVASSEVLHVAQSLYHDHIPARAAGLATA